MDRLIDRGTDGWQGEWIDGFELYLQIDGGNDCLRILELTWKGVCYK